MSASAFAIHYLMNEAKGKNTNGYCEKTLKRLTTDEQKEVLKFLNSKKIEAQREVDIYTKSLSRLMKGGMI